MTTFVELYDLTVEQTRKPELQALTEAAIRVAVLRAHHFDFFPADLREGAVVYTPSSNAWQYDIPNLGTLLPRYRAIKTLYGTEPATQRHIEQFEFREVDDMYTTDGERRSSVYTLLGSTLRVVPAAASGTMHAYYYQNPDVTALTFSSWIADAYPEQMAMLAASSVWNRTGFREMSQNVENNENKTFREMLISSHLLGEVN
jgi:hypothetical protein